MWRIELWLLAAIGALIAFVLFEGVSRPPTTAHESLVVSQQGQAVGAAPDAAARDESASDAALTSPAERARPHGDVNSTMRRSAARAPARDLADIRSRIRSGTAGTYIQDMLLDQDSTLFRWPERPDRGVRVWVQTEPHVPDFWVGYAQMARDVFNEWSAAGLPIRFDHVPDSTGADIVIRWKDRFPADLGRRIGSTRRTSDQYGWIVAADINVAIHDREGHTFGPDELTAILRHEVGHALGLGHSRDRTTIMFPEETQLEIMAGDRETLRLLYSVPPGSLR
jgi:matrixin